MSAVHERARARRRTAIARFAGIAAATAVACWLPFQLDRTDVGLYDRMGLYALVAIGLTLLMGFAGQVSLGQGGFFLIGAYTSGLLTVGLDPDKRLVDPNAGIDPLLAVAAAALVSAAVAVVIGVPLMRLRGHYLAFATLAFALIAWSLLYAQDRFTGGQYGVTVTKRLEVFGHDIAGASHAAVVWGLVGLAVLLSTNLVASRVGRALQAIAANEPAAAASGVNVAVYKLQLFVFAAALAGLAGGLFTFYAQFLGPEDFVIVLSLFFVVMVSIGGLGSIYGAVVGAITIVYVEHKLRELGTHETLLGWDLPPQGPSILSLGVFGLLLIVIMLFFPHGLLPGIAGVVSWMRRRLTRRSTS
ncbi:MAG TPA: branched-chain amino acid ABC transporter permease [Labilithrix sp.]|nr:branched-chain amino acid ABC transporter permease [Labilithrix sp.]